MCRLYGFQATHPSRVECDLLEAQNSLILQSREDSSGRPNEDGWGLGGFLDDHVWSRRQAEPATRSEEFRQDAARAQATTVLAHVRRASIGKTAVVNAQPFREDGFLFAHQGHVGSLERIRSVMYRDMGEKHRRAIEGTTDSEHLFRLLMSRYEREREVGMLTVLRSTLRDVEAWHTRMAEPDRELGINVIWCTEREMVGARLGHRPLFAVRRHEPHTCPRCDAEYDGFPEDEEYVAVAVASEPITPEDWEQLPDRTAFRIEVEARRLETASLAKPPSVRDGEPGPVGA